MRCKRSESTRCRRSKFGVVRLHKEELGKFSCCCLRLGPLKIWALPEKEPEELR